MTLDQHIVVSVSWGNDSIALVEFLHGRGFSGTGKPRVMFRPAKKMGATGIREIREWARSAPGKYRKGQGAMTIDDEPAGHCGDLGYCGG